MATVSKISTAHLAERNMLYRMTKITRIVIGMIIKSLASARFSLFVFAGPLNVVAAVARCHILVDLGNGFLDRGT